MNGPFTDKTIIPPRAGKPHICKRNGLWRVSPALISTIKGIGFKDWEQAHGYAVTQNKIITLGL